jgi:adenine deaminase
VRKFFTLIAIAAALAVTSSSAQQTFDVVTHGGHVVDGTSTPAGEADIGITSGRIAAIGQLREAIARTTRAAAPSTNSRISIPMASRRAW